MTSIEKGKRFVRIRTMEELLLEYKLVKILSRYNLKSKAPSREEFVDYVCKNHRHKYRYKSYTEKEYWNRINNALGDCIAPPPSVSRQERIRYYIDYDPDDRESLLVTREGRKFKTWTGFIEAYLDNFGKARVFITGVVIVLVAINWKPIINYIWGIIKSILKI